MLIFIRMEMYLTMKSYACAVSGENDASPNTLAATNAKPKPASSSWQLVKATRKPKPPPAKQQFNQKNLAKCPHKHALFDNLDYNDAIRMKGACLSNESMLRKILDCSGAFTVNMKKDDNDKYSIVLYPSRELDRRHELRLKSICAKHNQEGFLEWLSGKKGWRYSACGNRWEQFIISRLNDLQSIVKMHAPIDLLYLFPGEMNYLLWCKEKDLLHCVREIRYFVERAKKKLPDTPKARRLKNSLLQTSENGPDCLIHWAYHDPQNDFPLTVVTEESMLRLVKLIVELLLQVLPKDAEESLDNVLALASSRVQQGAV